MKTDPSFGGELDDLNDSTSAAAWLKVPIGTLYAWRSRGKGPRAVRYGRQTMYTRQDLIDFALAGADR